MLDLAPDTPSAATSVPTVPLPARNLLAPGVYFGLAEDIYHADPAIGSGDMRRLVNGAPQYWWQSHLNPDRAPVSSDAMLWGRAFHKLVLEGTTAFAETFAVEPVAADIPGVLVSQDDLKAYCKLLKVPVSGTKAELAERIRAAEKERAAALKAGKIDGDLLLADEVPIWDEIIRDFRAACVKHNRTALKPAMAREIRIAASFVTANPHLRQAFQGGVAEVSVVWIEDGVRYKSRIDYLKPKMALDLKSMFNRAGRAVDDAIRMAIAEYLRP